MSQTKTKDVLLTDPTSAPLPDPEVLDQWVVRVRQRIWSPELVSVGPNTTPVHGKVDLYERLLAMQWELSKVAPEATHFQGYKYHSIQSVENHVNRLSAIYKIRIKPTHKNSVVLEGGVRLRLSFDAYCWDTDQHDQWEWEDDGEDLSKAGSYAQKYGLMKFFHMGDGQDPDAEAERGKPNRNRASASQARTPAPRNGDAPAVADDAAKASLYDLARTLPASAGWGFKDDGTNIKIDAMLKSKGFHPDNIRKQLVDAHVKAHGENCEHVQASPAPEVAAADATNEQAPA
jgi:hypothetical protein